MNMKNFNTKKIATLMMAVAMCAAATGCGATDMIGSSDTKASSSAEQQADNTQEKAAEPAASEESAVEDKTVEKAEAQVKEETEQAVEDNSAADNTAGNNTAANNTAADNNAAEVSDKTADDATADLGGGFKDELENGAEGNYDDPRGNSYFGTFTAQKLFDLTVDEVVEWGTQSWEAVPHGIQALPSWGNLYACNAIPEYAYTSTNGYESTIDCVNVFAGGYVNDDICVGMTYNEICDALGQQIGVEWTGDDMVYASIVNIDGRNWHIGYALSEEDINALGGGADISEMDPTSNAAAHYPYI